MFETVVSKNIDFSSSSFSVSPHFIYHYFTNKIEIHWCCRWVWFCCECSEHFDNSSKLATHSSVQHSNGMEICNICGIEYSVHLRDTMKSNETKIKLEIVDVREEDEEYGDDDDDDDNDDYDDNIESLVVNPGDMEEDEASEVFICNYCVVYFDTKNSMKAHMKSHRLMYDDSVERYKCQVDNCESSKIYTRGQDMRKHLQNHHHLKIDDISAFTVPMDFYNMNSETNKTSESIHSYECEPCGKKYNRKQDIIKHMRNLHSQHDIDVKKHKRTGIILDFPDFEMKTREIFKCEKCEERYLDLDLLMKHMNSTHESQMDTDKVVVHSEQTFDCKFCHENNFLSLHILKVHCEENHNFQSHVYLCPRCSDTFTYGRNMVKHLKEKHSDEKWTRLDFVKTMIRKGKGKHEKWNQLYACNFCPKTFVVQANVESHLESVHNANLNEYHVSSDKTGDSLFCHQCNMFVSKKKLRTHMKQHAESITPVCQLCNETFDNMNTMWSHMFTKHATSSFQCCLCPVILGGKREVIRHMRLLHGITVVLIEDPAQENVLRKESRIYVNGVLKYQCQQCTTIVNSFSSLKNHMLTHTGEKPIVCDQCSKQFRTVSQLRVHVVSVHENVRKYGCEYCGHAFACSSNLAQHIRIHTGEKPYVCELCGNRYAQSASLYSHKLTHAQNRCHLCTECGRAFHRVSRLRQHMKIHTGDRPPRSHICEVCQKGFRSNSEMKRHQQIHNAVRSYVCETCGAGFTVKKYLIQHYKVHRDLIENQHVSIETITDLSYDQ
uniref:Zinc finger protein 91 n=1 Tax=Cacopsylla melanoneura TaxID=428564 RepID=A0A8D8XLE0_9HEMI